MTKAEKVVESYYEVLSQTSQSLFAFPAAYDLALELGATVEIQENHKNRDYPIVCFEFDDGSKVRLDGNHAVIVE